jgi:hypothetical protein
MMAQGLFISAGFLGLSRLLVFVVKHNVLENEFILFPGK